MPDRSIVEAAARLRRQREPHLVATLVCTHGTAYRRPGARMVLTRFRWIAGSATGGCLEGDLASDAWLRTRSGEPVLVEYDALSAGAADDEVRAAFGLGCDGAVEVLLERAGAAGRIDALEFGERCLRAHRRGAVTTVYRSDAAGVRVGARLALAAGGELEAEADPIEPALRDWIASDMREVIRTGVSINRTYATETGHISVLIEAVLPPPRLFLFGTGHDAVPLAQLARQIGWDVVVCTSDPSCATRFSGDVMLVPRGDLAARIAESDRAIAMIMNHDPARDRDDLSMLLGTHINYIGLLGPRERMLRELGVHDDDPRIHAPISGERGAHAPHAIAIAIAIVAELQAVLARTPEARVRPRPSVRLSRVPQSQSWIESARS